MSSITLSDQRSLVGRRLFMFGLGVGMLPGGQAEAAQAPSPSEAKNLQLVTAFCAAWASKGISTALTYLSPDCVYRMTERAPRANGVTAIRDALGPAVAASDRVQFNVLESRALGPIVINHRVDQFVSKTRPLTWEGVGVFFVKDGQIAEWSDYTIRVKR